MTWTPRDVAAYDQLVAEVEANLDEYLAVLRKETAELGEMQALANLRLALDHLSHDGLCGALCVALARINREEEP